MKSNTYYTCKSISNIFGERIVGGTDEIYVKEIHKKFIISMVKKQGYEEWVETKIKLTPDGKLVGYANWTLKESKDHDHSIQPITTH